MSSVSAAMKERLVSQAREMVKRGAEARTVMGLPVAQEFFAEQIELAFEQFLNVDIGKHPGELAALHFRAKTLLDFLEHMQKAIVSGDVAQETIKQQGL